MGGGVFVARKKYGSPFTQSGVRTQNKILVLGLGLKTPLFGLLFGPVQYHCKKRPLCSLFLFKNSLWVFLVLFDMFSTFRAVPQSQPLPLVYILVKDLRVTENKEKHK